MGKNRAENSVHYHSEEGGGTVGDTCIIVFKSALPMDNMESFEFTERLSNSSSSLSIDDRPVFDLVSPNLLDDCRLPPIPIPIPVLLLLVRPDLLTTEESFLLLLIGEEGKDPTELATELPSTDLLLAPALEAFNFSITDTAATVSMTSLCCFISLIFCRCFCCLSIFLFHRRFTV